MVGQNTLIKMVRKDISEDVFPRFTVFVGPRGSEINEFPKEIADYLNCNLIVAPDVKADTIKDIITESYKCAVPTVYALCNVDDMSLQAKNALLKVTEEPPNKAYFVMTLNDIMNLLGTLKSRAGIYYLSHYSYAELKEYCNQVYKYSDDVVNMLYRFCETPGDIDIVSKYGPEDFYNFVCKVTDNIATVNGSNVFKIANSIKLKDADDDKYDLLLFLEAFSAICAENKWLRGVSITLDYTHTLRYKGVNKQMLFDTWILDIRKAWADGNC